MSFQIASEIIERDRRAETEDREPPLTASEINEAAKDRLLASMDVFADWLYGHCMNVPYTHTRIGHVPRDAVRRSNMLDTFDVPQLAACLLHPTLAEDAASRLREKFEAENVASVLKFVEEVGQ